MSGVYRQGKIHLKRISAAYWRVTFAPPPPNIIGPASIPELEGINETPCPIRKGFSHAWRCRDAAWFPRWFDRTRRGDAGKPGLKNNRTN